MRAHTGSVRVISAWLFGAFVAAQCANPAAAQSRSTDTTEGADREARALYEAATIAFDEGRFESACDSFARAYALSRRPELLFNQGSCAERMRLDADAVEFYLRYLEAIPQASNRAYVEARIRFLRAAIDASRVPSPNEIEPVPPRESESVDAVEPATVRVDVDASSRETRRPVWKRGWFWALVGGVTVAAIATPVAVSQAGHDSYASFESGSTGRTVFTLVGR